MDIVFQGVGNLGADPTSKTVEVRGEPREIVEFPVYLERRRKKGDAYEDDGGFWCDVTIWHEGTGDRALNLLQKGSRVYVTGEVKASQYTDRQGHSRQSFKISADYVAIDMLGLESVSRTSNGECGDATYREAS